MYLVFIQINFFHFDMNIKYISLLMLIKELINDRFIFS